MGKDKRTKSRHGHNPQAGQPGHRQINFWRANDKSTDLDVPIKLYQDVLRLGSTSAANPELIQMTVISVENVLSGAQWFVVVLL